MLNRRWPVLLFLLFLLSLLLLFLLLLLLLILIIYYYNKIQCLLGISFVLRVENTVILNLSHEKGHPSPLKFIIINS